ncbi:MAG: SAM-dependent methyltransferase [Chloroflexi bacterium]|nr:SAM-dependent methyltransferase [Chloroflexota bacterium]|tara:strand:- start:2109 stop:3311 length:1203 start_codon:yes stop_codon:yes gene_type:complete
MEKNYTKKLIKLKLESIESDGDTTSYYNGEKINIFGGIPGEIVLAELDIQKKTKRKKQRIFGIVKKVLVSSPNRLEPPCQFYGFCTGCNWQHIIYDYQLKLKEQIIFKEIKSKIDSQINIKKIIKSKKQFKYRNHGRFTIRRNGQIGFINKVTKKFAAVNHCLIMNNKINKYIKKLENLTGESSQLSIRASENTNTFLIQPKFKNPDIKIKTGQKHYTEEISDYEFQISSPSFFQINSHQIENMKNTILSLIKTNKKKLLVDAYSGVGTFGILLSEYFEKVIGVEQSSSAVSDAKINITNIPNYKILIGNSEDVIKEIKSKIDVVILDPSRKGCDEKLLNSLTSHPVDNIIYISCEPKTLARDLEILNKEKYKIQSITPIDLFPNTHHVESITLLKVNQK